jgi:drug/metabolite transporter (DMT)-like permease
MAGPPPAQRNATTVLSALIAVIGVAIIVRTVAAGGSPISVGLLLGVMFVLAGCGRLYVQRRG